ncbi:MAG: KH domain-containing protein [Clostridia bacterium]|nr:KH domain-containing protein [Clostridia bacterium]
MVLDLVKFIVSKFAENADEAEYQINETDTTVEIDVFLSPDDMGKVIGKQGKIAKAMRTLVRAASAKETKKYTVEIKEKV